MTLAREADSAQKSIIKPSTWGCKQVNSFIKQLIVSHERKQS